MASITLQNGSLIYTSRYDPSLVTALKAMIPDTARRWDKVTKSWIVDPTYGQALAQITQQYLGEIVMVPSMPRTTKATEQRLLEVRYIGACKDRGSESSAYGYCNGDWSVVFPEKTLRAWFEAEAKPDEARSLYDVLCLPRTAAADEVKSAYRRLARQWHPDVAQHEPNAAEMFMTIKRAYDILGDPRLRAKYDAGLALEASLKSSRQTWQFVTQTNGYRSPLRCGYVLATGREQLGRFAVESIQMWEDVVRADGKVLVTTWPVGADHFAESWV